MKTYIILAYPNPDGLCYAAYENVKKGLEARGDEVRVTDLYKENFDPVLVFNKEKLRRNMQSDNEMKPYRDNITWADRLVFVFPIWWGGMPAILKGFVDKVIAQGFAYTFKGMLPVGLLKGRTAWIITTHDTPPLFAALFRQDYGKILEKQVLTMCGIKTTRRFTMGGAKRSSPEKRQKWLNSIYDYSIKSGN